MLDDKYGFLLTPALYEFTQNYFACELLLGVPMEEEGDRGNTFVHFDKAFFMEEVMTPRTSIWLNVSLFTLIGLYDTGWYNINFGLANKFYHGFRNGCTFLDTKDCNP